MNTKYKFLQKDNEIRAIKYGFSITTLIMGGIVLIIRKQFFLGIIYAFIDYMFITWLVEQQIGQSSTTNLVLFIVWLASRIFISQNCNYWWYDSLIKKGFKEIDSPFSSFIKPDDSQI